MTNVVSIPNDMQIMAGGSKFAVHKKDVQNTPVSKYLKISLIFHMNTYFDM